MKAVRKEENNENQMVECHFNGSTIMVPWDRFISLMEADASQIEGKIECHYKDIVMYISLKTYHSLVVRTQFDGRKFIRYKEGAQVYGMSEREFFNLAKDAKAVYKRNRMVLVSIEALDEYIASNWPTQGKRISIPKSPERKYEKDQVVECHYNGATVQVPVNVFISTVMGITLNERKFVRYKTGAKIYGMCENEFNQLAHDADAIYKRNKMALVNLQILDDYMEFFHE